MNKIRTKIRVLRIFINSYVRMYIRIWSINQTNSFLCSLVQFNVSIPSVPGSVTPFKMFHWLFLVVEFILLCFDNACVCCYSSKIQFFKPQKKSQRLISYLWLYVHIQYCTIKISVTILYMYEHCIDNCTKEETWEKVAWKKLLKLVKNLITLYWCQCSAEEEQTWTR